ncbi:MAG: NAD+ synthase [Actinomycetota bacterium]
MKIALAQFNLMVGDIDGNSRRITEAITDAERQGAQAIVFPELAVTGYPPEDLLLRRSFVAANEAAVNKIAAATGDILAVVGYVQRDGNLYNAAAVCHGGRILQTYRKQLLPNYGVFDEDRHFEPGDTHHLFDTGIGVIGVCICEDAWFPDGPVISQGDAGAQVVLNINASPFHKGKVAEREEMLGQRARRAKVSIVYVNTVGGQDELVFDGASLVIAPDGEVATRLPQFQEAFEIVDVPLGEARPVHTTHRVTATRVELPASEAAHHSVLESALGGAPEVYLALETALHDYVRKNHFERVVLGLSGGIDSTLTAVIAADAIGPENVLGVLMPSGFSTSHSVSDAQELATNLGIETVTIPIAEAYDSYVTMLEKIYGPTEMGVAEENLQARIRGNLVMAISNRYGHLVVTTGNKSEMAVGYATLYGDMAGGFALLKDVFKTEVYELCRYRNSVSHVIPENVLTKAPSAELRPDQTDQDSLPPYDVLDGILDLYIEEDKAKTEIVAAGFDAETVERVIRMVDRAEYKRRQAPPGPKVTTKAFGRDRRLPITNGWRE